MELGEEFKFHLVGYEKVCSTNTKGGLGIHNLRVLKAILGI